MKGKYKALFVLITLCILSVFSSCSNGTGEISESDDHVKYVRGKIRFVDRLPDDVSPYDGMPGETVDYKWSAMSGNPACFSEEFTFFATEFFCFYLDGGPSKARTLCADPFCTHIWGQDNCITSYESLKIAPVGNIIYASYMNQVMCYNMETYRFEVYAVFNENISRVFSMGRYLYIAFKSFDGDDPAVSDMYYEYIRVDALTNSAEFLDRSESCGQIEVLNGKIYGTPDFRLTRFDSRLEEEYMLSAPYVSFYKIYGDQIYYIPRDAKRTDQLFIYDVKKGKKVCLLGDVRSFTILSDKMYVVKYDDGSYEANDGRYINKIFVYSIPSSTEDKPELVQMITPPDGYYIGSGEMSSGSNSLFFNLQKPTDSMPRYFRFYVPGGLWQDISWDYLYHEGV